MKSKVNICLVSMCSLLFALVLVACDGDNTSGTESTAAPLATDVGELDMTALPETPLATVAVVETPVITETMEETPMATEVVEEAATATEPAVEATEMVTPTVEATEMVTPTVEAVETTEAVITDTMTNTLVTQAILASDLVGMDITNDAGEEVGEVSELLVDEDGTVQHVLFDVGGFLGIGEKTVAVTADQFEIRHQDGTVAEPEAEFDVSELTVFYTGSATDLEDLPAFDANLLDADGSVIREPETENTDSDPAFDPSLYVGQLQVSEFQDYNLLNMADEDIGEVEDLIVDLAQSKISYAVVDVGGFLGIGENSVAVPWDQFTLETDGDAEVFRIDTDVTALEDAPTFDISTWTYPIDLDWDSDVVSYWDMH